MKLDLSRIGSGNAAKGVTSGIYYGLEGNKTSDRGNDSSTGRKGRMKLTFDVKIVNEPNEGMSADGINYFKISSYPYWTGVLVIGKNLTTGKEELGVYGSTNAVEKTCELTPTANGFHKVEVIIDTDKNEQIVSVDGEEKAKTNLWVDVKNKGVAWLQFIQGKATTWSSTTTESAKIDYWGKLYTLIDNLEMRDENSPAFGIESVQYSADGINYTPAVGEVDCDTKYVKVDFTNEMTESDGIKLLNNQAQEVASSGAWSNGNKTYTLTLTDSLATSANYTLNIPTTVKTKDGNSMAREYNGAITTTDGIFRVDVLDIQNDSTNSTVNKSDIAAGTKLNAYAKITNTERRTGTANFCICVYNNDIMTQMEQKAIDLSSSTDIEVKLPVTVKNASGIKVKAFLWSDFTTLKPLVRNSVVE